MLLQQLLKSNAVLRITASGYHPAQESHDPMRCTMNTMQSNIEQLCALIYPKMRWYTSHISMCMNGVILLYVVGTKATVGWLFSKSLHKQ